MADMSELTDLRSAYAQLWRSTRPIQLGIIWKPLHIALRFKGHWHTLLSFAW